MSIAKLTEEQARRTILSQARQFVEDTPWDEPGHEFDHRIENLAKFLSYETGADIDGKATADLRELVTTLEELQSLDAGTHWRIQINPTHTIDNRLDLRDELNGLLRDNMYELLQASGFRPVKTSVAA
jgi:hypothetical protein